MLVRELVNAARFLELFLKEQQLVQKYQSVIGVVKQAAQGQQPQNLTEMLDALQAVHAAAETWDHSPAELHLLEQFGALDLVGTRAAGRISSIFDQNKANPQAVAVALEQLRNETNNLTERAKGLTKALGPMLEQVKALDTTEEEERLWLYFAEDETVDTVEALKDAADDWQKILHHFARVSEHTDARARLLHVQKGSPLVIEVAAASAVLAPFGYAVSWAISQVRRIVKIRQEAEKLRQMKVKTKIIEEMLKQVKEERQELAKAAADNVKERFRCSDEARTAVQKGMERILRFIEGGGQLDILDDTKEQAAAEEREPSDERREFRAAIATLRRELKALPPFTDHKPESD